MRIIRNRVVKSIILIYNKYINKVAYKFNLVSSRVFLLTLLLVEELYKSKEEVIKYKIKNY